MKWFIMLLSLCGSAYAAEPQTQIQSAITDVCENSYVQDNVSHQLQSRNKLIAAISGNVQGTWSDKVEAVVCGADWTSANASGRVIYVVKQENNEALISLYSVIRNEDVEHKIDYDAICSEGERVLQPQLTHEYIAFTNDIFSGRPLASDPNRVICVGGKVRRLHNPTLPYGGEHFQQIYGFHFTVDLLPDGKIYVANADID